MNVTSAPLQVRPLADPPVPHHRAIPWDALCVLALAVVTLAHGLPGLASNPPLSYDEGYDLQASINLLRDGVYGTRDLDGYWAFDPHITTGPTVMLPVAAVLALFGTDVAPARAIIVLYSALAAVACYLLLRLQTGRWPALLGALLLSLSLYPYHRLVLGEVPGLFWMLAGAWLWLGALQERQPAPQRLALAGIAFGLAALTKTVLGPISAVAIVGAWLLGQLGASRPALSALTLPFATAAIPIVLWYGLQGVVLGPSGLLERFAAFGEYRPQLLDPTISHLWNNRIRLWEALPPGLAFWAAAGVLASAALLVRRGYRSPDRSLLPLLTLGCLGYFMLSVGWPRYGFWVAALLAPLVALSIPALIGQRDGELQRPGLNLHTVVAVGASLAVLAYPLVWTLERTAQRPPEAVAQVAAFLQEQVAPAERVGTTEWELDFVTGRVFKHPPTVLATVSTDEVARQFDWSWPGSDWVVVGKVGEALGADKRLDQAPDFIERASFGEYTVFQRYAGPPPGWLWSTTGATPTPALAPWGSVGQSFIAAYDVLTEARFLLSGRGRTTNGPVRLDLYNAPGGRHVSGSKMLASVELAGEKIVEDKWYSFEFGGLAVEKGSTYYLELSGFPGAGQHPVGAWYNSSEDHYQQGGWYANGVPQEGDLYFGVLGYNHGRR